MPNITEVFLMDFEKETISKELEEWLNNYQENKLNDIFNKR